MHPRLSCLAFDEESQRHAFKDPDWGVVEPDDPLRLHIQGKTVRVDIDSAATASG